MGLLNTILRGARGARQGSRAARYLPFSEPPFRGNYPLRATRGLSGTTNGLSLGHLPIKNLSPLRSPTLPLYLYEDRRLWHPEGANAYPKSIKQAYPRTIDKTPLNIWPEDPYTPYHPMRDPFYKPQRPPSILPFRKGTDYVSPRDKNLNITRATPVSWENPYDMIICLKRKIRRELMHALGYSGKQIRKFRKPKYTQFSFVRCR